MEFPSALLDWIGGNAMMGDEYVRAIINKKYAYMYYEHCSMWKPFIIEFGKGLIVVR
jgi:hypothetical protein